MIWASHYGDSQNRKRLIILAAKQGYRLPSLTHGEGDGMKPMVCVQDVLHDLGDVKPNDSGRVDLTNGKTVHGHYLE